MATRALGPALLAGLGVAQAWRESGSIAGRDWTGYGVLAVLALAAVLASGASRRPSRPAGAAATALGALAAWDAIALSWTPSPSLGRDEALLALLYGVALLLPTLLLRTRADRITALAAIAAIGCASALATMVELVRAGDAAAVYLTGRLQYPVSYTNAQAAFFLVVFWPALVLGAARTVPLAGRAAAFGAAGAAAAGWALVQSKGGLVGLVVSSVVVLAVHRRRLRLVPPLAVVWIPVAAGFAGLTAPYRAGGGAELAAIHHAGTVALAVTAAAAVAGAGYAAVDRRIALSERTTRRLGRAAGSALVVAVVAAVALFLRAHPDPGAYASAKWSQLKHQTYTSSGGSHLTDLGSNRYDFWRVALRTFEAHPLAGIGTRGFRDAYLQNRHSPESPARAHSVELDALSETGIVGFLLLASALVLVCRAVAPRARGDLVSLGVLGAFACWLAQTSVDWTWSFPAVGLPLFALLGVGAARTAPPAVASRVALPAAGLAVAVALGAFGLPWLATQYVQAALHGRGTGNLATAESLDPISLDPYLAAAALAPTPAAAAASLRPALRKEPRSPDLRFAIGRDELAAGNRAAARLMLRSALRLDPRDPVVRQLLRAAER